jgi:hypothetical protein
MTFETFYTFDELDAIATVINTDETFVDGITTKGLEELAFEITGRCYEGLTDTEAQNFVWEWCDEN